MPAHRLLPDDAIMRQLRTNHGPAWCPIRAMLGGCNGSAHTYDEIADGYGVTKGAVYLRLNQMGMVTDTARHRELIPWRVRPEHMHAYPVQMLRLLARQVAGKANPPAKQALLDKWIEEIREAKVVVTYDPSIPPNAASPNHGGWAYLRRTKADGRFSPETGKGVIRQPAEGAVTRKKG